MFILYILCWAQLLLSVKISRNHESTRLAKYDQILSEYISLLTLVENSIQRTGNVPRKMQRKTEAALQKDLNRHSKKMNQKERELRNSLLASVSPLKYTPGSKDFIAFESKRIDEFKADDNRDSFDLGFVPGNHLRFVAGYARELGLTLQVQGAGKNKHVILKKKTKNGPLPAAPPLNESNKGYQMLKKLGWNPGEALGQENRNGLIEPVSVSKRPKASGLGFVTAESVKKSTPHSQKSRHMKPLSDHFVSVGVH